MEGIPLALVTERSPMLELLVTGNLECIHMYRTFKGEITSLHAGIMHAGYYGNILVGKK